MPSPDFLLFGDGELEESGSDKVIPVPVDEQASGDTDYGHGSGENESWLLGVHELFNHRNGQNPDLQVGLLSTFGFSPQDMASCGCEIVLN
mmetsp:Transcript_27278/g.106554  ORF Transcript_27278/g.106554 Transcript_27278/m.106554 type:complete len:91 (+) Transcript_27278:910-1182(+)